MNFNSLNLKRSYSSDFDDMLFDFYIPALELSVSYDRSAGYFTSSSLAVAACGIIGLIKNGGKMRLITSARLAPSDIEEIKKVFSNPLDYLENKVIAEFSKLEDEFVRDHVRALGWMIANGRLEIKIAYPHDESGELLSYEEADRRGIFHQKVGIMRDSYSNIISFSGSINETAKGWLQNIEEFKVFTNRNLIENEYVQTDIARFERYWKNEAFNMEVVSITDGMDSFLKKIAPTNIDDLDLSRFFKKRKRKTRLFQHQQAAIEHWINNGMIDLFEMATGTGKTLSALGCVNKANSSFIKLATFITCPTSHLIQQWESEIEKFGIDYDTKIIVDKDHKQWRANLTNSLIDMYMGHINKVLILTTHSSFSSPDFIKIVSNNKNDLKYFMIADESHGLGSKELRKGLCSVYDLRLGLSATWKRWFDSEGTTYLFDYFGNSTYEFGLEKALNNINPATGQTYLTPFKYEPIFVFLSDAEMDEYLELTKNIVKNYSRSKEDKEKETILELLMYKRADIIKNAEAKHIALDKLLDSISKEIKGTLIYCTPQQISKVINQVGAKGYVTHSFTMETGTIQKNEYGGRSERQYILNKFGEGKYAVLVAMKCLDEGVDVPEASKAIFMASSGNPREFVQRIGRVLRRYPGKTFAKIYDFIVVAKLERLTGDMRTLELEMFKKEEFRFDEISRFAIDNVDALNKFIAFKKTYMGGN